ncbi:MAG: hypothetical protein JXR86_02820 [Spirochaetales bacterium]|nr:hypothetical protein [Spirochaetales bacterium]
MEEGKREIEDYLKDLKEIKKVMDQAENYGIIETWVYWVYGILIIASSVLSYYLVASRELGRMTLFMSVWLPTLFLAGVTETVGWVKRMDKMSAPLLSNRFTKLAVGFLGPMVILGIMMYYLLQTDIPHAGIYLMAAAMPLFMYSQITYSSLMIEAWVLTGMGFLFIINQVSSLQGSAIAGIVAGITFVLTGFHVLYLERRRNG